MDQFPEIQKRGSYENYKGKKNVREKRIEICDLRKKRGFGIQSLAVGNEDDVMGVKCHIECKLKKQRSFPAEHYLTSHSFIGKSFNKRLERERENERRRRTRKKEQIGRVLRRLKKVIVTEEHLHHPFTTSQIFSTFNFEGSYSNSNRIQFNNSASTMNTTTSNFCLRFLGRNHVQDYIFLFLDSSKGQKQKLQHCIGFPWREERNV